MKKIMVVAGYAPSLVNFRGPLLRALVAGGHQVTAVAPDFSPAVSAELAKWGVALASVPLARAALNPIGDWAYCRALRRLFRRAQPDVILAYTHKPVVYSALAAHAVPHARVYALITGLGYAFADSSSRSLKQRCARRILCWLYRRARARWDGVMFQNEDDRTLFQEMGLIDRSTPQQVVRGSGIDLAAYPQQPVDPGPLRFLLVARLLADKGIREYAEAARAVRASHPEVEFYLAGPLDPNPAAITALEVESWHRAKTLVYLGPVEDVRPLFTRCSVYVLPSYREGTPRTVLEAMATGRPVITTDTAGCRDTLFAPGKFGSDGVATGANGLLIPVRDAAALCAAFLRLIHSPGLVPTMGAEGRRLAEEHYAVEKINAVMLAFMDIPAAPGSS